MCPDLRGTQVNKLKTQLTNKQLTKHYYYSFFTGFYCGESSVLVVFHCHWYTKPAYVTKIFCPLLTTTVTWCSQRKGNQVPFNFKQIIYLNIAYILHFLR